MPETPRQEHYSIETKYADGVFECPQCERLVSEGVPYFLVENTINKLTVRLCLICSPSKNAAAINAEKFLGE